MNSVGKKIFWDSDPLKNLRVHFVLVTEVANGLRLLSPASPRLLGPSDVQPATQITYLVQL